MHKLRFPTYKRLCLKHIKCLWINVDMQNVRNFFICFNKKIVLCIWLSLHKQRHKKRVLDASIKCYMNVFSHFCRVRYISLEYSHIDYTYTHTHNFLKQNINYWNDFAFACSRMESRKKKLLYIYFGTHLWCLFLVYERYIISYYTALHIWYRKYIYFL